MYDVCCQKLLVAVANFAGAKLKHLPKYSKSFFA